MHDYFNLQVFLMATSHLWCLLPSSVDVLLSLEMLLAILAASSTSKTESTQLLSLLSEPACLVQKI